MARANAPTGGGGGGRCLEAEESKRRRRKRRARISKHHDIYPTSVQMEASHINAYDTSPTLPTPSTAHFNFRILFRCAGSLRVGIDELQPVDLGFMKTCSSIITIIILLVDYMFEIESFDCSRSHWPFLLKRLTQTIGVII